VWPVESEKQHAIPEPVGPYAPTHPGSLPHPLPPRRYWRAILPVKPRLAMLRAPRRPGIVPARAQEEW
jgi:hypothetical protein